MSVVRVCQHSAPQHPDPQACIRESRPAGGASTRRAGNIGSSRGNTAIQLGKTAMSADTSDAVLTLVININGDDTLRTTAERWLDHDGGQCWGKASSV